MCNETGNAQSASTSKSSLLERVHSKEADILAISELTRALDKKVLPKTIKQAAPVIIKRKYLPQNPPFFREF